MADEDKKEVEEKDAEKKEESKSEKKYDGGPIPKVSKSK